MSAPALAIGAVFPLAVRLAARERGGPGQDLSVVYGLDTLGAALGALLAGFFLVPQCGLSASTWILGVGAIDLGLFILLRQRAERDRAQAAQGPAWGAGDVRAEGRSCRRGDRSAPPAARLRIVLATFFLSGAAALLLETGWNRFFPLLNGTHLFSTSTVLAGFLTGVGLGSLLMSRFIDRIRDPYLAVAGLYAAVAFAGMAVFHMRGAFFPSLLPHLPVERRLQSVPALGVPGDPADRPFGNAGDGRRLPPGGPYRHPQRRRARGRGRAGVLRQYFGRGGGSGSSPNSSCCRPGASPG